VEAYIGVRVRAKSPWKPTGGGTSGNARQTEARVDEPRFKRVLNVNMYDEPACGGGSWRQLVHMRRHTTHTCVDIYICVAYTQQ